MKRREPGASGSSEPAANGEGTVDMFRVLIVARIRLYREGLAQILDGRGGLSLAGMACDRPEAIAGVQELSPQIVLLDMATPESHATAREIERLFPEARVVALGVAETEDAVLACAEAGVAAYVPRDGSVEDLVETIKRAARGEVQCSPQVAGSLWRRLATLSASRELASVGKLTRREREIVRLIDREFSNKEIARQLGIEVATVKNHVHNLLDKLHVSTRKQAAAALGVGVRLQPPRPVAT